MNQANKQPLINAVKKRRDYLFSQVGTVTTGIVGLVIVLGAGFLMMLSFFFSLYALLATGFYGSIPVCAGLAVTAFMGYVIHVGRRMMHSAGHRYVDSTYVPPVAEQMANLPNSDVLVRASNASVTSPNDLLRAASERTETAAAELLRPSGSTPR